MQSVDVHDNRLNVSSDDSVSVVCRFCEIGDLEWWILEDGRGTEAPTALESGPDWARTSDPALIKRML